MRDFKVGDKLRVLVSHYNNGSSCYVLPGGWKGPKKGDIVVVKEICDYAGVWIDSHSVERETANRYFEEFELAEEEKVKNRFCVGDKVITVKDTSDVPEGFIGHITSTTGSIWPYTVVDDKGKSECFKEDELELLAYGINSPQFAANVTPKDIEGIVKADVINSPKHYSVFESVEAIQVIASSMTQDQFYGYCLGNILKYRLRAGGKDDVMQELGKADKYQELYTQHKHLCKEGK